MRDNSGIKNPNYKDGRKGTRLYSIYRNMISRCYNPNTRTYRNYGGRGIGVCEEWLKSFVTFKDWALSNGYKENLTIDRINVDGDYCSENCRWVTLSEQCLNRRNNHYVKIDNSTKPLDEWSKIYGINPKTVRSRLKRGWDEITAIKTPLMRGGV